MNKYSKHAVMKKKTINPLIERKYKIIFSLKMKNRRFRFFGLVFSTHKTIMLLLPRLYAALPTNQWTQLKTGRYFVPGWGLKKVE